MKIKIALGAAVFAAVFFIHPVQAAAQVYEVSDGTSYDVGCQGGGDNNLNDGSTTYFLGSGSIHGTLTPASASSWAIWRNYLITNGVVTIDSTDVKGWLPLCQRSWIVRDQGKLVVSNANSRVVLRFGNSSATQNEWFYYDIPNIEFVDKDGQTQQGEIILTNHATVENLPPEDTYKLTISASSDFCLAVAASDFLAKHGTTVTFKELRIFDDSYIPDGAALTLGEANTCTLTKRSIDPVLSDLRNVTTIKANAWTDYGSYGTCNHAINLSNVLKVESTEGVSFTQRLTGQTDAATVNLSGGDGFAYTFADLAGTLSFVFLSGSAATVSASAVQPGARLFFANGMSVTFAAGLTPSEVRIPSGRWYVFPDADGRCDFTGLPAAFGLTANAALSASGTYHGLGNLNGQVVSAAAGADVTFMLGAGDAARIVGGAGTVSLVQSVCNQAAIWADPSIPSAVLDVGDTVELARGGFAMEFTNGYHLVEAIRDAREGHTGFWLRNGRLYNGGTTSVASFLQNQHGHVYPYLATEGGPNGLSYLSCGKWKNTLPANVTYTAVTNGHQVVSNQELRRMPICKDDKGAMPVSAKMVVMVFGSQYGGGAALIGEKYGAFDRQAGSSARLAASAPIMTNEAFKTDHVWVDGKAVDPTTTGLNGGWQIVSMKTDDKEVTCFGWSGTDRGNNDYNNAGGQNYGEILVFTNELSAAERVSVERYLAKKWGISTYAAPADVGGLETQLQATVNGTAGTVKVDGNFALSGVYSGNFELADGATLTIPPKPNLAEPTDDGLLYRFDPDYEGSLLLGGTEDHVHQIMALWPRGFTAETLGLGTNFFYGVGSRRPFPSTRTVGFGATRTWIDFDHAEGHTPATSDGNTLRLKAWSGDINDSAYSGSGSDTRIKVQTVLMVTDSFRGGGDPLRQGVSDGGDWGTRGVGSATKPIWTGANARVTGGTTRLNGVAVDGTTTGYTGEGEVLAVRTTGDSALGNLGNYTNSEKTRGYAEMLGELLCYSRSLSDTEIKAAEDYLLYKWLGVAPAGSGDFSGATVTGAGTVRAKAADLPKFGDGFKGTIAVTDETTPAFEMAVSAAGQPVEGALVAKGATLTGFTSATINVSVSAHVYGTFTLVDLKAVGAPITWTVNLSGGISESVKQAASVEVTKDGASVVLKLVHPGTMILIR